MDYNIIIILLSALFFFANIFLIIDAVRHKYSLTWVIPFSLVFIIAFPCWLFYRKSLIENAKACPVKNGYLKISIAVVFFILVAFSLGRMQAISQQLSACGEYRNEVKEMLAYSIAKHFYTLESDVMIKVDNIQEVLYADGERVCKADLHYSVRQFKKSNVIEYVIYQKGYEEWFRITSW